MGSTARFSDNPAKSSINLLGFILSRLVLPVCLFIYMATSTADTNIGGQLFVLHSARKPFNAAILDHEYISGIAVQIGWRDVEPGEGKYDWTQLDEILAAAREKHKLVTIHLLPLFPPEWVFSAGVQPLVIKIGVPENPRFGKSVKQYVPWDPVFLDKWSRLTRKLGDRYAHEDTLFAVSVTAPEPEMVIPWVVPHTDAFTSVQKIYNKDAYLRAWRQMIDLYQQTFPTKPKFLAPGIVLDDAYFSDDVLEYAHQRFGNNLWVFNAGLRATNPPAERPMGHIYALLQQYSEKSHLGFQMIGSATNDRNNRLQGSLQSSLENGIRMGASYIEVYEDDLTNPSLRDDIKNAARTLQLRAK